MDLAKHAFRRIRRVGRSMFAVHSYWWLELHVDPWIELETAEDLTLVERSRWDEVAKMLPPETWHRLKHTLLQGESMWFVNIDGNDMRYSIVADSGKAWVEELNRVISLQPHEAYLHSGLTLPAFRGRGIHTRCMKAVLNTLHGRFGITRFFACVRKDNPASLQGLLHCGVEKKGAFLAIKWLGRYRWSIGRVR